MKTFLAGLLAILAICIVFYTAKADEGIELAQFRCNEGVCSTTYDGLMKVWAYIRALEGHVNAGCGKAI